MESLDIVCFNAAGGSQLFFANDDSVHNSPSPDLNCMHACMSSMSIFGVPLRVQVSACIGIRDKSFKKIKSTTQGIPRWSPIQVLTLPDTAYFQ